MDRLQLRKQYESERSELNSLCDKWQQVLDSNARKITNDETKGAILSILGQTRLLLDKKLKQFEQLLSESENGEMEARDTLPITLADLQGFWELVMLQVNDVHAKFVNLEKMNFKNETTSSNAQRKAKSASKYRER